MNSVLNYFYVWLMSAECATVEFTSSE